MGSTKFFLDRIRGRPGTTAPRVIDTDANGKPRPRMNYEEAFGFSGYETKDPDDETAGMRMRGGAAYDEENIRLAPYSHKYGGGMPDGARSRGFARGGLGSEEGESLTPYASHSSEATQASEYALEPVHVHEPMRGSGAPIGSAI